MALLVLYVPFGFPESWWLDHNILVLVLMGLAAHIPFILILAFVFAKLFRESPISNALACVSLGMGIANLELLFESPAYLRSAIGEILFPVLAFVVGVPLFIVPIISMRARHSSGHDTTDMASVRRR